MTEIDLLIDLHKEAERQGPGSTSETKRALDLIPIDKFRTLKIADIGCGTGAQTITLAQNTPGSIVAVDFSDVFLKKLKSSIQKLGFQDRVTTLRESMDHLPFKMEEFDIIWSEGAIYNIGFSKGIKEWKKFLKIGGYLAVSELSWITSIRPQELEAYWSQAYPEIDTVSNKIRILEDSGYTPVGHFVLPEYCWTENYYNPLESRFDTFLRKYPENESARKIIESEKEEIQFYKKYKSYYSYGFYVAKRIN